MTVKSDTIKPLLPALCLWRMLGVLPFSSISLQRVKIYTSPTSHTISIVIVIAATTAHFGHASYILLSGRSINFVQLTGMICGFLLVSCVLYFARTSCAFLQSTFRSLGQVDTALLTTPGNPHRGLIHVLLSGIMWLARAAITVWLFNMPLCDILLFPLWFVILAAEQLTVVLSQELARRYRAINSALQGMKPTRNNKHPDTARSMKFEELRADKLLEAKLAWLEPSIIKQDSPTTLTPARVELLREAHSSLADAFQELNNKLGVFLLIDLAYLFIVLLSTSINFLQHCIIQSNDDRGDTNSCVGYAVLAMDGLVRMGIITVSCGAVGEEAERTAEAAARLLRRALDWDALRELQILGAQVRARRVAFWACGLFTVDRPLLFSICGAVTSYLFILSQLK